MEKSPLRRLSPELRNQIYELTFTGSEGITIDCRGSKSRGSTSTGRYKKFTFTAPLISLTRTCQQIRMETCKLFYARQPITIINPAFPSNRHSPVIFPGSNVRRNIHAYQRLIGESQLAEVRQVTLVVRGPKVPNNFHAP